MGAEKLRHLSPFTNYLLIKVYSMLIPKCLKFQHKDLLLKLGLHPINRRLYYVEVLDWIK